MRHIMGVIKPPWITNEWFRQCPFNYCDHFGNQERLAEVCKICKEELEFKARCLVEGRDPNDLAEAFKVIGENFAKVTVMINEEADRMGIDLNNIEDDYEDSPPAENYPIYELVSKYGDTVERIVNKLSLIPKDSDMELLIRAVDAFSHSRYFAIAKTDRALSSKWGEERDPEDDIEDSKTSALFAFIAMDRNSRAALALAHHKPLVDLKLKHLKFAKLSLEIAQMIKQHFFPKEKLVYREFGCEDYDECFDQYLLQVATR